MKIKTIVITLFFAFTLLSCSDEANKSQAKEAVSNLQVEGYKVIGQAFNSEVVTTAEIMANEQVELMAPISGQVLDIYFKEGELVNKGQSLIRIDDRSWKAQLIAVKASLENAQKDYNRKQELIAVGGSSQGEVDEAFSLVQTLKSQLEQLQVNIDLANVSAPFSGRLGMRNFSKGAFLQQGNRITTLTETKQLKVDFTLAQQYISSVKPGKTVSVLIARDTFDAEIYALDPVIDANTRMLNVRALMKQPQSLTIMPGTFAEVLLSIDFINDALLIPSQAVVPSINDQTVYVINKGRAVKKVIEVGNRTKNQVHVIKGLAEGDTLITTGLLHIQDGVAVTLLSVK